MTKKEKWWDLNWRPAMAWMYLCVCSFDFIVAPILWTGVQLYYHGPATAVQWQPLTLQGGGLFHIAMGAVLGISSYGRTKEKIDGGLAALSANTAPPQQ